MKQSKCLALAAASTVVLFPLAASATAYGQYYYTSFSNICGLRVNVGFPTSSEFGCSGVNQNVQWVINGYNSSGGVVAYIYRSLERNTFDNTTDNYMAYVKTDPSRYNGTTSINPVLGDVSTFGTSNITYEMNIDSNSYLSAYVWGVTNSSGRTNLHLGSAVPVLSRYLGQGNITTQSTQGAISDYFGSTSYSSLQYLSASLVWTPWSSASANSQPETYTGPCGNRSMSGYTSGSVTSNGTGYAWTQY